MISAKEIKEILETYRKYGWKLRKILLSRDSQKVMSETEIKNLFGDTEISNSKTDGALFFRDSKNNMEAWELRHLHSNPFALFELIDFESSDSEKESILKQMENRLENYASNKPGKDH